jgi:1-acyl-sn-glycerol-3-phosphate acyltransferase
MNIRLQWCRSLLFNAQMYLVMLPIGLAFAPWAIVSRKGAFAACHTYCRWVRWTARWMIGLHTEVRGTPPDGEVIIAAKHQSFLDIILIFGAVPAGKFIMKKELVWAPLLGQYALRIGCIPVDRGRRGEAVRKMIADVQAGRSQPGQLIIFPQGTRVAPGVVAPYKIGTAALYRDSSQDCVPVAVNVGVFWGRRQVMRRPGRAVVEFLAPIPAGLPDTVFMSRLEMMIETHSEMLMAEAGFGMDTPIPA